MKSLPVLAWLLLCVFCVLPVISGCAPLMRAFTTDSPRPNKDQLETAKTITTQNVPVIAGMQTDKQRRIGVTAMAGLRAVSRPGVTPEQAEAITNIVANASHAIQNADGTAKILGQGQAQTLEDVLKMNTMQYMAGIAAQGAVAMHNQAAVYSGIKTGWQWTSKTIAAVAGASTGGLGLIGFASAMAKRALQRKQLLEATGGAISEFRTSNPEAGVELKSLLADAHSSVAVDAKKEFGLS